jgi:hypothetical protein
VTAAWIRAWRPDLIVLFGTREDGSAVGTLSIDFAASDHQQFLDAWRAECRIGLQVLDPKKITRGITGA